MTATVILSKVANVVDAWEGEGFIVTFYNDNFSAIISNVHNGYERTMYLDDEVGIYCDSDFCIRFVNGMPVLDLFYGDDESLYDDSEEEHAADEQFNQDAM